MGLPYASAAILYASVGLLPNFICFTYTSVSSNAIELGKKPTPRFNGLPACISPNALLNSVSPYASFASLYF